MNYPTEIETAEDEWDRARFLHQNYLERLVDEPSKAGEHLWGAINNLASAIHRLEFGSGISSHRDVLRFLEDLIETSEQLTVDHKDAVEDLHGHYYHGDMSNARLRREMDRASTLYDYLDRRLGEILDGDAEPAVSA